MKRAAQSIGAAQIVMRARTPECVEFTPPTMTDRVALWQKRLGQYRASLARQKAKVFQILDARAARAAREP